jgi:hypothetical protein
MSACLTSQTLRLSIMLARSLSAASAQTVARVKTQAPSRHGARALRLLGLFCSEMRAPENYVGVSPVLDGGTEGRVGSRSAPSRSR